MPGGTPGEGEVVMAYPAAICRIWQKICKIICRICKKKLKKYANPFSICRILTGLYSAYFAYIYSPYFADAELLWLSRGSESISPACSVVKFSVMCDSGDFNHLITLGLGLKRFDYITFEVQVLRCAKGSSLNLFLAYISLAIAYFCPNYFLKQVFTTIAGFCSVLYDRDNDVWANFRVCLPGCPGLVCSVRVCLSAASKALSESVCPSLVIGAPPPRSPPPRGGGGGGCHGKALAAACLSRPTQCRFVCPSLTIRWSVPESPNLNHRRPGHRT